MKRSRHNSEHYFWGDICEGWKLIDSHGLSIIEENMPPGSKEIKHFHQSAQQFFYILEGEAIFSIENQFTRAIAGEGVHILPKQRHSVQNEGDMNLKFLVISQPTTKGDRIEI